MEAGEALEEKNSVSFKRKKRFALFPCKCLSFLSPFSFGKPKPGKSYRDQCFRTVTYVKNHTPAAPLDGGSPNIWGEDEIDVRDEDSMNSSDPVWVFQLCCEKPLALNSSDLSYFLETDVSTVDTR